MRYRYQTKTWPQLSALVDTMLELPEEERLTWLESLPADHAMYRPHLLQILEASSECNELLDNPPDFSTAIREHRKPAVQLNLELQPGNIVHAYRLIRLIGSGGMAAVWLAERVDGKLKRQVALKFPYAGPRQRQLAERLARERDILASLQHSNIAHLYDTDVTSSGQPFLVLEYIDGININEYCDKQKLDVRQRLVLFQQVLSAVRYAHTRLVIHRDLKPSNILITPDGVAHLLDFGIATVMTANETPKSPITQFDGNVLTPEYASPEQVCGIALSTVSDVYSAGVMLYELLTDSLPYEWKRDQRARLEQAIINAEVRIPSNLSFNEQSAINRKTDVKQLRNTLRGELDTILLKALKKQPHERYTSVDAFSEDINRYLNNQPILARADSHWYRTSKFVRRNRVVVASFAAVIAALFAGSGVALWQAHVANLQRDRALSLAKRGDAIAEYMRTMVTEIADVNEPITLQTLLKRSESVVTKSFAEDTEQKVAVLEVLGSYYLSLNQSESAKEAFNSALALSANNADVELIARLNCNLGQALNQLGDIVEARKHVQEGLSGSRDYPEVQIACLQSRAAIKFEANDMDGVIADIDLAKDILAKSKLHLPLVEAMLLTSRADAEVEQGNLVDAEEHYSSAMQQITKLGRASQTYAMTIENNWAGADSFAGNPRGALEHLDKAWQIARSRNVSEDNGRPFSANRAAQLHKLARYQEALDEYRRGVESAVKNKDVSDTAAAKQGEARTLIALGRLSEAKQLMKEVESMIGKQLPVGGGADRNASVLKGLLLLAQHQCTAAVPYFSSNIESSPENGKPTASVLYSLRLRGEAYLCAGDLTGASNDATRAYKISHSMQGGLSYSKNTGEIALLLSKIEDKQNHLREASEWSRIAYQQLQGSLGDEHPTTVEARDLLRTLVTRR